MVPSSLKSKGPWYASISARSQLFCWFFCLFARGVSGENFVFYFLCVLSALWGGACGKQKALISADIRFYWFLLQGGRFLTQPQRKDKVQSTSRDLRGTLWPKTPQTNSEKKRKKNPERFPAGRERSTHTQIPTCTLYLYFLKRVTFVRERGGGTQ